MNNFVQSKNDHYILEDDGPSLVHLIEEADILHDTDPQRQRPKITSDCDAAAAFGKVGAGVVVFVDAELALAVAVIEFAILPHMLLNLLLF